MSTTSIKNYLSILLCIDKDKSYEKIIIEGKVYYIIYYKDLNNERIEYRITPVDLICDLIKYNDKLMRPSSFRSEGNNLYIDCRKYEIYKDIVSNDSLLLNKYKAFQRSYFKKNSNKKKLNFDNKSIQSDGSCIFSESFPSDKLSESDCDQSVILQPLLANLSNSYKNISKGYEQMSKTKFSEIELKDHLSFIFMMIYQFIMILLFTCGVLLFRIIEIIDGFITKEEIKKELITNSNESNKVDFNESNKVVSNESKKVDSNESNKVDSNESNKVDSNESNKVDSNESKKVDSNESNKVDSNENKKVDSNESNVEENSLKPNNTSSTNKSPHVSSKEIKKPVIIDNHDLLLNKTNDMVNPQ
ncbi:hypothetical protein HERIO_2000 [Hepatospora eriocheir]|uniref:Uncharacterized protein n=1 Tax=Hepatospora eriocheir TaxID=1081669 RepID=A0A1X0Q8E2_9MICR|nr:hypothetical protein HERIO_2000 [Hepatospora eriocheir]